MTTADLGPAATPERLAELARHQARYDLARRALFVVMAGIGVALALVLIYLAVQTRQTASQVKACTTPGARCYEQLASQGRANRALLLDGIQDALVDHDKRGSAPTREGVMRLERIQATLDRAGCLPAPEKRKATP